MSLVERVADLQYRMFDAMRNKRAFDVAREQGTVGDFETLRGQRQSLIVSFKRSGEPVPTPVNFGLSEEGKLYFRSEPRSAKVKRIRREPHVRVCACNMCAKPTGPVIEGQARVVSESEKERAEAIVAANWTPSMKVLERGLDRLPLELCYVEVEPRATAAGEAAV